MRIPNNVPGLYQMTGYPTYYCYRIEGQINENRYYPLNSLTPIGVYDSNKNLIRRR